MINLSILTFNVWMLPRPVPGMNRRRRLTRILAALRDIDADIVAIQEAFAPGTRRALVDGLGDRYRANDGALEARRDLGLLSIDRTGGMLVLSKFPIRHASFTEHPLPIGAKFPERVGRKGVLHTTIETPVGKINVLNVHFYAGGKPADRAARTMQLHHFSRMLGVETDGDPLIIAGDFNAWPEDGRAVDERSQPEYRFLRKIGLLNAADGSSAGTRITYDVGENPLAAFWSSKRQGGQEFDSIFYRPSSGHDIRVNRASVVLNDGEPLSDHYGYLAEVRVRARVSAAPVD
jgi:endonuclease/exonuclease/phosphatase family metal-dependent hydrolase